MEHESGMGWRAMSWPATGMLLAAMLLAAAGLAESSAASGEDLVVGFEEVDFLPYGKPDPQRIYIGYLRDVLDAYADARGHRLSFEVVPVRRLYRGRLSESIDFFGPDNPAWTPDAKQDVTLYYSQPVAWALDGFAVLPGREEAPLGEGIQRIGTIVGFTIDPLFSAEQLKLLSFDRASELQSLLKALLLDRVDAVHCNRAVAFRILHELGRPTEVVAWSRTLPQHKSPFMISSQRPGLIDDFDDWMRQHPGVIASLKDRYGLLAEEALDWGHQD